MLELNQRQIYTLLLAQLLALFGHLVHAPIGVLALWMMCAFWRWQIARMRWGFPGKLVKLLLIGLGALFVWQSRGSVIGLEAGVVLLITAFSLKIIEARTVRDAKVVIFLGFFVVLTAYLFETALWLALYSLLPIALFLAIWQGLYSPYMARNVKAALKSVAGLMVLAAPLMVLLFLAFPRIGPLWSMPMPSDKRLSGLSERMSPADIAELSQSSALAFRATFEDKVPAREMLYWRALTLDYFDGRSWSHVPTRMQQVEPATTGETKYSVLMQPNAKPWLFVLDAVSTVQYGRIMANLTVQHRPVEQAILYAATSTLSAQHQASRVSPRYLQLPETGEPQARLWAQQLKAQYPTKQALVQAILEHFRQQNYYYSLKPGTLGDNSIDQFLFATRTGFCAHYAGAMTFVLRAAGIPARVVAGYQGGELTSDYSVQVRQFDAHAWVEYWEETQGWTRVDPTYAVAPERIEQGLEEAVAEEQSFLADSPFSPLRYRKVGLINQVRLSWDQLNYRWHLWVLGFDRTQQQDLWGRLKALKVFFAAGALLGLALLAGFIFYRRKPRLTEPDKSYAAFEKLLKTKGLARAPAQGPMDFAVKASARLPQSAEAINAFTQSYIAQKYAGTESLPALKAQLKALRKTLTL